MTRDFDALVAFLEARAAMPFAWGKNDCVTFAAGAVLAMTGEDALAFPDRRPTWKSAAGAARRLAQFGGLEAAVSTVLTEIPVAMAHRGDVGLVEVEGRQNLCIFEGDLIVAPGEAGLVRQARANAVRAWSAGCP